MKQLWSPLVQTLEPYVPGEQPKEGAFIKLNTNENPYGPSPRVAQAIASYPVDHLRLYPDPNASGLKTALADYHGLQPGQVFVGNGSDEVLGLAFMAFFRQAAPLLYPTFTYSFYPAYCKLFGIEYRTLPLAEDFSIRIEDYFPERAGVNGGIIFANPNAPTGRAIGLQEIESLLQHNLNSVVLVDEAYVDFGADSAVALIDRYPNLLVVQTYSKSRSLAGMRLGFALGDAHLIEGLERVKNSFNSYPIDSLTIRAGIVALEDEVYFQQTRSQVIRSREWLTQEFEKLGFEVLPSKANFIFTRHPEQDAENLYLKLKDAGLLVRYFNKPGIDQYLRISIGTQAEVETLVEKIRGLL